jgi:UDP-N-acetyl-D-galactosamine dehydrogenase
MCWGCLIFKGKQVVHVLNNYGIKVTIFDPLANTEEVMQEYGLECHTELDLKATSLRARHCESNEAKRSKDTQSPSHQVTPAPPHKYDAIVLGVAHKQFININLKPLKKKLAVVYDVK